MSSSLVPLALSTPKPLNVRPFRLVALTLLPSSVIAVAALPLLGSQGSGTIEPPVPAPLAGLPPEEPPAPDPAPPIVARPASPAPLVGCELPPEPPLPAACAAPPACGKPPVDEPVPAPASARLPAAPLPHDSTSQTKQTQRKLPTSIRTEPSIGRVCRRLRSSPAANARSLLARGVRHEQENRVIGGDARRVARVFGAQVAASPNVAQCGARSETDVNEANADHRRGCT